MKHLSTFLNEGKRVLLLSILISAAMALLISAVTGDPSVWSIAIPIGVACGVAIQSGWNHIDKHA